MKINHLPIKQILYWGGLTLGGGLFVYQLFVGIQSLGQANLSLNLGRYLLGVLITLIGAVFMQMVNWRIVIAGLGVKLGFWEISKGYVLSFLPRYIPGTVWGYFSRGTWLQKEHNIPNRLTLAASALEVLATLLSGIMVASLALSEFRGWTFVRQIALAVTLPTVTWFLIRYSAIIFSHRAEKWLTLLHPLEYLRIEAWWLSILGYLVHWIVLGLATFLAVRMTSPGIIHAADSLPKLLLDCAAVYGISWIVGLLIILVPAGLGVREFVLIDLLSMFVGAGWNESAITATTLRVLYLAAELVWLLWAGAFRIIRLRARRK